ncbi:MAG: cupin [Smithella sp.]|nr:cupin [Smithella sp.]
MTIKTIILPEKPPFPNAIWPVLIYTQVYAPGEHIDFAGHFKTRGWTGVWVNGVYSFDHFHATAHEALGCISGWVLLRLGGPEGVVIRISAGDAVLLPAGAGHRNLRQSGDFCIVGAYPPRQSPDIQRGDRSAYPELLSLSRAMPRPETDPVSDRSGIVALWKHTA